MLTAHPCDFDVIVLATGDPAGEKLLFRRAWREDWTCRLVCAFVEAANLGGHAIAMQPGEPGCLECLYEGEDPEIFGLLRTGMLAPGQSPSKEISGELALPDSETGYHRWAGSDASALELGLHPSEFWAALRKGQVQPFVFRQSYIRKGCPCCGS
ncbi:hypothetical protein CCP3SC1_1210002 [Gammaproteobacteria bacterium]